MKNNSVYLIMAIMITGCGEREEKYVSQVVSTVAPAIGKADSTDTADRSCEIILRSVVRPYAEDGMPQTHCHNDICSWFWNGVVEVSNAIVAEGGSVAVLYHESSDAVWWEVPVRPVGPGFPGYTQFSFVLDEHVFGPSQDEENPVWQSIELIPFVYLANGNRLFDHNQNQNEFDNYWLTIEGGYYAGADGYTCKHRPKTAAVRFDANWDESVLGQLFAGGKMAVHYDLSRLPNCRHTHNGYPAWDTMVYVKFLPVGEIISSSVRQFISDKGWPTNEVWSVPFEVEVPADAKAVEIWFQNISSAGSSCEEWDSNYGQNYQFEIGSSPESDPCFGIQIWNDRYTSPPSCFDYSVKTEDNSTNCEFFLNSLGHGYEGHYGIPFRWLEAYLSVGPQDGQVLNVGMYVEYFDHTDATNVKGFRLGQEIEPNYWLTGFNYIHTGYMGDGSYAYTVQQYAFFIDVKRPSGEVVRLWHNLNGAKYNWDDAFSLPTSTKWIPYGRIEYADEASSVFNSKHTCQDGKTGSCIDIVPGDGGESEPCAQSDQCDGKMYCNYTKCICYPPGECITVSDCSNPGNDWNHPMCVGSAKCTNGLCEWLCS